MRNEKKVEIRKFETDPNNQKAENPKFLTKRVCGEERIGEFTAEAPRTQRKENR